MMVCGEADGPMLGTLATLEQLHGFGMRRDSDRQRRYNSAAGAGQSVEDFKAASPPTLR